MAIAIDAGALTMPQVILMILIAISCVAGMVLHFMTRKYRRPDLPRSVFKDSLFTNAEAAVTEEGVKYVRLQKNLVVVATILVVLLFAVSSVPV